MPKLSLENHTECPACKNNTLPPFQGGDAITCKNPDCLAIVNNRSEFIGKIEAGVAVYDVNRLSTAVELITNQGSPGYYIKPEEFKQIKDFLEHIRMLSREVQSLIETIEKR